MDGDSAPAPEPTPRRFALGDLMALIVGFAFLSTWFASSTGIAGLLNWIRDAPGLIDYIYFDGPQPRGYIGVPQGRIRPFFWHTPLYFAGECLVALLFAPTPTVLLWRLRGPRPPWRRLLCQPGFVACVAVFAEILIEVDLRYFLVLIPTRFEVNIGLSIAVLWACLGATKRWCSEPIWIDRLGRAVGVGWIVVAIWGAVEMARNG